MQNGITLLRSVHEEYHERFGKHSGTRFADFVTFYEDYHGHSCPYIDPYGVSHD